MPPPVTTETSHNSSNITVVYASDANYVAITAVSAVSVLRHNPNARIVLLGYGLSHNEQDLVRTRVESHSGTFAFFNVSEEIRKLEKRGYAGYTSYAAYSRVFIPKFLEDHCRVLYLDCDTLVHGSLYDLFKVDLEGKPFALAADCVPRAYKKFIRLSPNRPYFNSGVMLMDLDKWREHRCTERVLEELRHPRGPNPLGDQDVIVRCFLGEITSLPPKWNALSQYWLVTYKGLIRIVGGTDVLPFSEKDYEEAREKPVISHFSGNTLGRPWFTNSRHPMRETYREAAHYAGLAPVAEQVRPMPMVYSLQYWLFRILPQPLFDKVCFWLYRIHIYLTYKA